ncbi:hypothetical protein [Anabaena sp. CCY 0017]|uniref:hypothetical protein n=1 Tax=Anabaena sp. CCY 0017 TaxID=3103866 RepID=UPI0039C75FDA
MLSILRTPIQKIPYCLIRLVGTLHSGIGSTIWFALIPSAAALKNLGIKTAIDSGDEDDPIVPTNLQCEF